MGELERISGYTHMISLIGNPTHHSSSPATHNLSFQHAGIDTAYLCFEIGEEDLRKVLDAMKAMDTWDGSNVTMPLKQAIIPYLDEVDDGAALMGAVNVVDCKNGKTKGYNTDGMGFMINLRAHGVKDKGAKMTLVGCGGAGSAVLTQAALDGVAEIDVFEFLDGHGGANVRELAPKITEKTGCKVTLYDTNDKEALKASIATSDILTNSSPVGMGKDSTDTPVPPEFIKEGMVVADTVYFPRETQLLKDAKAKGCTTVSGVGMMIAQAAAGEKIWYGIDMDTDFIEKQLFSD